MMTPLALLLTIACSAPPAPVILYTVKIEKRDVAHIPHAMTGIKEPHLMLEGRVLAAQERDSGRPATLPRDREWLIRLGYTDALPVPEGARVEVEGGRLYPSRVFYDGAEVWSKEDHLPQKRQPAR
jgi:hypothetical protein